jgi:hypothetical protein
VRDPLWRRARAVPTLDLRFADNKSLTDAVTGASLVTFTRASSGTYVDSAGVLQTASTDVPRFDHNPTTGESLGLLVEEQRANLLVRSEEFDNASWGKTGLQAFGSGSITDAISAPNGTTTADFLVDSTATGEHFAEQSFTVVSGTSYTFSVFIKPNANKTGVMLRYTSAVFGGITNQIQVVFATGAVTVLAGTPTGTATPLLNGWWRISITGTATANGTPNARVQFYSNNGTSTSYTGDGTSGYYLWGAQLETGAFPTSYIPTTTAAVTRSADVCSITGSAFSSWYSQSEGTMFAECAIAQPVSGGNQFVFRSSDNTFSNSIGINIPGAAQLATAAGGVFDGSASSVLPLVANVPSKIAGAYASNNLGVSLNGATAVTDSTVTIPTSQTRADIGSDHIGANRVKAGTIRRLAFWGQRLPNNVLQQITQ